MMSEPLKERHVTAEMPSEEPPQNLYNKLSITPEETGIINIPYNIVCDMFEYANTILTDKCGIVPVPGSETAYYVLDSEKGNPRKVTVSKDRRSMSCEKNCHRWNGYKFCSHIIALAQHLQLLFEVISKYISRHTETRPNMTTLANTGMPSSRGKKGTKATQIRKGKAHNKRPPLLQYGEPADAFGRTKEMFHLTFLAGIIKKCYGCGIKFANKYRSPPYDIILKGFEFREYICPETKMKKMSKTKQNTYYHLNPDCIRKRYPLFETKDIIIHDETKQQLNVEHETILRNLNVL